MSIEWGRDEGRSSNNIIEMRFWSNSAHGTIGTHPEPGLCSYNCGGLTLLYRQLFFFWLNVCFIVTLIKLIEMYKPLTIGFVSSITRVMISHVIILEPAANVQCVINCWWFFPHDLHDGVPGSIIHPLFRINLKWFSFLELQPYSTSIYNCLIRTGQILVHRC